MSTPTPGRMAPADFLGRFAGLLGERASYRLETLDVYHDPSEEDDFRRFRDHGEPVRRTQWWYDHVRRSLASGKVMARVHVVSEPLTAYLQFEINAYLVNGAAAGEDVRILPRPRAAALGLPTFDYWLMDSKIAYVLSSFGCHGDFGVVSGRDDEVAWCGAVVPAGEPGSCLVGKAEVPGDGLDLVFDLAA